jgi:hypothetical protein
MGAGISCRVLQQTDKEPKPPRSMCAVTEGNFLAIPCIGLPAVIPEREGRWLDVGRRALDLALETRRWKHR